MYTPSLILVIVYCITILYVYFRYNMDATDNSEYDKMYREKLDISASEAAYLLNKNCSSIDIILADILTLVEKGYIKMETRGSGEETDYIFEKVENASSANIKNHEMAAFRLLFKAKDKVSLNQFVEDLIKNEASLKELEEKMPAMKNEIEYELRRQDITDKVAERRLLKFNRLSITLMVLFSILLVITVPFRKPEYLEFSSIGILLSILLYKTTGIKEDKLTSKGVETKKKAQGFKKFLQEYIISKDKPLYMVNVLEYNYTMAIAFGLSKIGKNEFIHDEYKRIKTKKIISDILTFIVIVRNNIYKYRC